MNVLEPILGKLESSPVEYSRVVAATIREALDAPAGGTMRAWMERHSGRDVTTVQAANDGSSVWAPTGRVIDASRATFVEFNGSTRYYAGMRVLHTTDSVLIVADEWHTIAYVIEGE